MIKIPSTVHRSGKSDQMAWLARNDMGMIVYRKGATVESGAFCTAVIVAQ
jgi:hypothetical protein